MIIPKELLGEGNDEVKKILTLASTVGCDVIELLWVPDNGQPRFAVAEVSGYKKPVVGDAGFSVEDDIKVDGWVDYTLKFYPDVNGRCWGYVYDTPENRELLYRSFSNNWFRVVDKKVREELLKEAHDKEIDTEIPDKIKINVKVTKREREAEDKVKATERKLEEAKKRMKELEEILATTKGEKADYTNKRLKGVKVPNRDEILNANKSTDNAG